MRIVRFLGEDGRIHHGEACGDGSATVLLDPHGVLGAASDEARRQLFLGRRALVADDDANMREMMATVLTRLGCDCALCADGAEAIDAIETQPLDFVVSDILMPHHNGYEVFAAARARRADIPVLLVTGFGYDPHHSLVRAAQEGLSAVLYKPFTPVELRDQLANAVCAHAACPADMLVRTETRVLIRRLLAPLEPTALVRASRSFPDAASPVRLMEDHQPRIIAGSDTAVTCTDETLRISRRHAETYTVRCGGELAVVMGRLASRITPGDALACVLGYTIADDLEVQRAADGAAARRDSVIAPCALGPSLITADAVADPDDLAIVASVNGRAVRRGSTGEMLRPIATLIAEASRQVSLQPGAVVLTGPPPWLEDDGAPSTSSLNDGDEIAVEIGDLGRLVNRVQIA